MRLLDLFCGRWGWSKAFAARGWECVGVDLVEPPEIPQGCTFMKGDVREIKQAGRFFFSTSNFATSERCDYSSTTRKDYSFGRQFDFVCASSPCEQFSVFDLRMWFPNPKHPNVGIDLFNYTRGLCEAANIPYVMENVRAAQRFVGNAVNHCGPFYLWGSGVPAIFPQGITKGSMLWSPRYRNMKKSQRKQEVATIPPELANCIADYADRLMEIKQGVLQ